MQVSATNYNEVVGLVETWAAEPRAEALGVAKYICVTSVHGIITARHDPELRISINAAEIATPDGMPVVWALRSFGAKGQDRVYGPTLMLRLCEALASAGHGIFLYGGRPEVLPSLCERLHRRIPRLTISGSYSPPFRPLKTDEDRFVVDMIRASGAALIFVGISTPKQEKWMAEHRQCLPGKIMVGVGAAFDFHAGRVRQAPDWVQRRGLEWLFRLLMEPRRLWRRYLLTTPQFLPLWGLQKLRTLIRLNNPV